MVKHENTKERAALNGAAIRSEVVLPRVPWALSHLGMIHTGVQEVIDTHKQTNKKRSSWKKKKACANQEEWVKRKTEGESLEITLRCTVSWKNRDDAESSSKKKKVALQ